MRSLFSLAVLAASTLAITITGPSAKGYWVQNTSNVITWTFDGSDPSPIDITITNDNEATLNGVFSIDRNVDLHKGSFTVTNVTLKIGTGYVVNFVNGTNQTQLYASSQKFEVKTPGTPKPIDTTTTSSSSTFRTSSTGKPTATSNLSHNAPTDISAAGRIGDLPFNTVSMIALTGLLTILGAAITF